MALIVETGEGLEDANSFATIDECDLYHEGQINSADWDDADAPTKEKALRMASRLLDASVLWKGVRKLQTQALGWPRLYVEEAVYPFASYNALYFYGSGYRYYDSDSVPKGIKDATCELARELIKADRTAEPDEKGVKSVVVGPISVEFDASDRVQIIPKTVRLMLRPFGRLLTSSSRYREVRRV